MPAWSWSGPSFVEAVAKVEGELHEVRTIVAIGGHDRWQDYEAWVSAQPADDAGVRTTGDDIAFQLDTSGTTGLPKGVMLTTDNFFGDVASGFGEQWRFDESSVNLAMMPMFHITGAGWSMVGLFFGCRMVVLRDIDPARILQVIPEF